MLRPNKCQKGYGIFGVCRKAQQKSIESVMKQTHKGDDDDDDD